VSPTPEPKLHALWRGRIRRQAQSDLTTLGLPPRARRRASENRLRRLPSISLPHPVRVFLHAGPADLRKGFGPSLSLTIFGRLTSGYMRTKRK
jgi:hypothetical protein